MTPRRASRRLCALATAMALATLAACATNTSYIPSHPGPTFVRDRGQLFLRSRGTTVGLLLEPGLPSDRLGNLRLSTTSTLEATFLCSRRALAFAQDSAHHFKNGRMLMDYVGVGLLLGIIPGIVLTIVGKGEVDAGVAALIDAMNVHADESQCKR